MQQIKKYELFELSLDAQSCDELIIYCGCFNKENRKLKIPAFKSGPNIYKIHFMPDELGAWEYQIIWEGRKLNGFFECIESDEDVHGPVRADRLNFSYVDGKRFIPIGTTCYAWTSQTEELQEQTIKTLANSPFNKVRMCIFPKSLVYNREDPELFPFEKNQNGNWNVEAINYHFWDNLEKRIAALTKLNIEADLILFHPYDRWGFAKLNQRESMKYLEYVIVRFSAYRNIWWSLANEYEMLYYKTWEDWDEYGEFIHRMDPYHHLISVHNILKVYPKRHWLTHCSIQSTNINNILNWRKEYQLPIVMDECGYEGNIDYIWGNLSAFEMVHRFWWTTCRGGYCTHGETFDREDEVLWWSKGGILHGNSLKRIQFLKDILYSLPSEGEPVYKDIVDNPNTKKKDKELRGYHHTFRDVVDELPKWQQKELAFTEPMILKGDSYLLRYMGRTAQSYVDLELSNDKNYTIEILDIWEMTRTLVNQNSSGKVRVTLPEKEGIAILASVCDA
ncbi:DUF5605 domain-containing protein [Enterococcus sp. DIV0187]|uniref:DUF5605 domain-containing protein n=1 Tax=Enterococcus sp. DIV0187 TaxID=2774644 RepID=UPI003F25FF0B